MSSVPVEVDSKHDKIELDHTFLQETPRKILEREYLIHSGTLADMLSLYRPLEMYLSLPTVQPFLSSFTFLKCGIKLRLMLSSTPMVYGVMVISWLPNWGAGMPIFDTINSDPTIINLCGSPVTELNFPYCNCEMAYTIPSSLTLRGPSVFIHLPSPVRKLNSTDADINFRLYCSLTDVKLFGATAQSGRLQVAERSISLENASNNMQMVPYDGGSSLATTGASAAVAALGAAAPEVAIPLAAVMGVGKLVVDTGKWLYESYEHYMGGEPTADTTLPFQDQQPSYVKQEPYGPMAACAITPTLALTSNRPKKLFPIELGDTRLSHPIQGILRTPTISQVYSFSSNIESLTPVHIEREPLTVNNGGNKYTAYFDQICSMFRFWRGSISYRIYFFTSPLVSAQFTITYHNVMGSKLPSGVSNIQQVFRKTITVTGFEIVDFTVPCFSSIPWIPIQADRAFVSSYMAKVTLNCDVLPRQVGDNVSYVDALVCVSAGPDFQVRSLCSPAGKIYTAAQMNLRNTWESGPLISGGKPYRLRDIYEDTLTIEEISLRYSYRSPVRPNLSIQAISVQTDAIDLFDFCSLLFHYQRGSVRMKIISTGVQDPHILLPSKVITNTSISLASGNGISFSAGQGDVFDIEIPFECDHDWIVTATFGLDSGFGSYYDPILYNVETNLLSPPTRLWVAAGRDYQLAHLMPPLVSTVLPIVIPP